MNRSTLSKIVDVPEGATSFTTLAGLINFCIGETGELVNIELTPEQTRALSDLNFLGTFGHWISSEV